MRPSVIRMSMFPTEIQPNINSATRYFRASSTLNFTDRSNSLRPLVFHINIRMLQESPHVCGGIHFNSPSVQLSVLHFMFAFSRRVVLSYRLEPNISRSGCFLSEAFQYQNNRWVLLCRIYRMKCVDALFTDAPLTIGHSHGSTCCFINSMQALHQFKDTPSIGSPCCHGNSNPSCAGLMCRARLGRAK